MKKFYLIVVLWFAIANLCFSQNLLTNPVFSEKSSSTEWPFIELSVASGSVSNSTVVGFNERMTNGLDVTYDAGLFRSPSGLNLYSRLVEDNGVDFVIQCLPTIYSGLNIQLGVECKNGGEIVFTARTSGLPADALFELYDKETNVATSITDKFSYTVNVDANAKITNRFYLRSKSAGNATSVDNVEYQTISAYANSKHIYINGAKAGSSAQLFDVNGRCIASCKLLGGSDDFSAEQFIDGVYILKVYSEVKVSTLKMVLK